MSVIPEQYELLGLVDLVDLADWQRQNGYQAVGAIQLPDGWPALVVEPVPADDYPAGWKEISRAVKEAAGGCCEHCGHPHDRESWHVLTVHHLDGVKANCVPENLVALCQRCHLSLQARLQPGQLVLPFALEPWMERRGVGSVGAG